MSMLGGNDTVADIGVVVEGSYPFVQGGVASWTQQLIQSLPEFSFHLIVLVARHEDAVRLRYDLPKNITGMTIIALQDGASRPIFLPRKNPDRDVIQRMLLKNFDFETLKDVLSHLRPQSLSKRKRRMLFSRETFEILKSFYNEHHLHSFSFLDYFWQVRSLILSMTNCLGSTVPACRMYHSLSTGYAGLMLAVQRILRPNRPTLLTEHGIYTRERAMEICMTSWPNQDLDEFRPNRAISFYANLWTRVFRDMATSCYEASDRILSLFERNNRIQIEQGAEPSRVDYIFNGIDLQRFEGQPRTLEEPKEFCVGFLGRVVKIKDVKTFIRAAALIAGQLSKVRFEVAGPGDEDLFYQQECEELTQTLGLQDRLSFTGRQDAAEFFERIDVMVLTSLSEGQPLVILEGFACGVPCVATDVGACREIIEGNQYDRLGRAGHITPALSPRKTADAVLRLLQEPAHYAHTSQTAWKRARKYYDEKDFLQKYRQVYQDLLEGNH